MGTRDGSGDRDSTWSSSATRTTRPIRPASSRRASAIAAERVRKRSESAAVDLATDTLRRVDVTVILGQDFRPEEDGRP